MKGCIRSATKRASPSSTARKRRASSLPTNWTSESAIPRRRIPIGSSATRKDLTGKYWYDGEFNNVLFKTPPIEDDGVSFTGSSEFTVKIDPANRGVRVRRRLDKDTNRQKANVYVDGRQVMERPWYTVDHDKTYRDIRWVDSDFEIPAKYTDGKSSITLKIENAGGADRAVERISLLDFQL